MPFASYFYIVRAFERFLIVTAWLLRWPLVVWYQTYVCTIIEMTAYVEHTYYFRERGFPAHENFVLRGICTAHGGCSDDKPEFDSDQRSVLALKAATVAHGSLF